jgi:hypothetical protein
MAAKARPSSISVDLNQRWPDATPRCTSSSFDWNGYSCQGGLPHRGQQQAAHQLSGFGSEQSFTQRHEQDAPLGKDIS